MAKKPEFRRISAVLGSMASGGHGLDTLESTFDMPVNQVSWLHIFWENGQKT